MTDNRIQIMNPHFLNKQQRGTQIMAGNLQIEGVLRANNQTVRGALTLKNQATESFHAVRADRSIESGSGLKGGGDLTGNRSLWINTDWMDDNYVNRKNGAVVSGYLNINTDTGDNPFYISRNGYDHKEYVSHYLGDTRYNIVYDNDESASGINIRLVNHDDEFNNGEDPSDRVFSIYSNRNNMRVTIDNDEVWHEGNFDPDAKADRSSPSFIDSIDVGSQIRLASTSSYGTLQAGDSSDHAGELRFTGHNSNGPLSKLELDADSTEVTGDMQIDGKATFTNPTYPLLLQNGWLEFADDRGSYSKFMTVSGDNYTSGGGKLLIGNVTNSTSALFTIQQDNRVGIREVNPDALFHVNNNGSTAPPFYVDMGDYPGTQTLFNHTGAQNHQPFRMVKSNDTSSTGSYRVLGVGRDTSNEGRGSIYSIDMKNSAGNWTSYGGIGAHIASNSSGAERGTVTIYTTDGGSERSEKMTIHHSGRVGVGDNNPEEKLTVAGSILSNVYGELILENSYWGSLRQGAFTDDLDRSVGEYEMALSTRYYNSSSSRAVNQIWHDAGGTTLWTSDRNGNRRIMQLYDDGKLDVNGDRIKVESGGNEEHSIYLKRDTGHSWKIRNNSGHLIFNGGTSYADHERMRIDSSGRVGIRMSSPQRQLDVNGDIGINRLNRLYFYEPSTHENRNWIGSTNGDSNEGGSHNDMIFGNDNDIDMFIGTGGSGRVGIGTVSPQDHLHVNGGARFESGLRVRGENSDYVLMRFERHSSTYDSDWNIGLVYGQFTIGPYSLTDSSHRIFMINDNNNIGISRPSTHNNADSELHVGGRTESDDGFKTGNYEIVHNTSEDSLDIMYVG